MSLLELGFGSLLVIIIRLTVPFLIFRWPLAGAVVGSITDTLDVVLLTFVGNGAFYYDNYTYVDKALDWWLLLMMAIYALRWSGIEKKVSLGLFGYRTIGVILLETTGIRQLLFVFPNLFILFFYAVCLRNRFFSDFEFTKKNTILLLLVLLIPKLLQEYLLHVVQLQPWTQMRSVIGI